MTTAVEEFIIKPPNVCGVRSCMEFACVRVCTTNGAWIGLCSEHISEIATAMMFEESTDQVVSLHASMKSREEAQP